MDAETPSGPAPRPRPINPVLVVAGMLAVNAFVWLFTIVRDFAVDTGAPWSGPSFACGVLAAGFLGAFVLAPVASSRPVLHAVLAGAAFWIGCGLRLLWTVGASDAILGGFGALAADETGGSVPSPFTEMREEIRERVEAALRETVPWIGLVIPGAALGALASAKLGELVRRRTARETWELAVGNDRAVTCSAPWRSVPLGTAWFAAGILIFAMSIFGPPAITYARGERSAQNEVAPSAQVGVWTAVMLCLLTGRKYVARSVRDKLSTDQRPPVVYLRSFADDGRSAREGVWSVVSNVVRTVTGKTWEQTLARVLRKEGPVVAIGRPGEQLPHLGAARMYVGDADWKETIGHLLAKSGLVILQAGLSPGLRWEFETVARMKKPEDVLLFVPFRLRRSRKRREADYAAFRAWASESLPAELPATIGDSFFITFRDEGGRWAASAAEYKRGSGPDGRTLEHPRSHLLTRLVRARAFNRRPPFSLFTKCLIGIALVFLTPFVLFSFIGYGMSVVESLLPVVPL